MATYTAGQKKAMAKMSPKRRASFKKMLAKAPSISSIRPGAKKRARPNKATKAKAKTRRAKPNRVLPPSRASQAAYAAGYPKAFGKTTAGKPRKTDFIASQERKGRSPAQAKADWNLAYGKARRAAAKAKQKPQRRTYGKGKYRALKAKVGTKSLHTYLYKTPKGNTRHIPEHAVLGYPSARALKLSRQTSEGEARYQKRKSALDTRRGRYADRAAKTIRSGKGIFTPNPGAEVLSFEEWKEMYKPNKKTRSKGKAKKKWTRKSFIAAQRRKGRSAKQAAASWRMVTGQKKGRKPATRKSAKKGTSRKTTTTRQKFINAQKRKGRSPKQAAAAWKLAHGSRKGRKPAARKPAKRRTTKRAKSLTITMRANKPTAAQLRASRRNIKKAQAARYRKNSSMRYQANTAAAFADDMKGALKIGAIVVTGYMAHRAMSKVLNDFVLAKVEMFQTGGLAKWRDTIAGIVVAAVGVPLAVKVVPRESAAAGAGIAASLLHSLIITALTEAKQPDVVAYLSNYPNASSPAAPGIGSYYTFKPRQLYGTGEYYSMGPGALTTGELTSAAAGYQPMQAAAGAGAMVTQAAAGEYLVYGAQGIGDNYEEVATAAMPTSIDEGIAPNLNSAEQALNVMEAAAGVGMAEIPLQSTVNPLQYEDPIGDAPAGSRSGIFEGGGGIFS